MRIFFLPPTRKLILVYLYYQFGVYAASVQEVLYLGMVKFQKVGKELSGGGGDICAVAEVVLAPRVTVGPLHAQHCHLP